MEHITPQPLSSRGQNGKRSTDKSRKGREEEEEAWEEEEEEASYLKFFARPGSTGLKS